MAQDFHLRIAWQGLIPGGQSIILHPPPTVPIVPQYNWTVDVPASTNMVFLMFDSSNHQGGASDLKTVGASTDTSCLNANSPSSTITSPNLHATTKSTSRSKTTTSLPSSTSHTPNRAGTGIVAGAAIGGLLALAGVVVTGVFCLRKRARSQDDWTYNGTGQDVNSQTPHPIANVRQDTFGQAPLDGYDFPVSTPGISHTTAGFTPNRLMPHPYAPNNTSNHYTEDGFSQASRPPAPA